MTSYRRHTRSQKDQSFEAIDSTAERAMINNVLRMTCSSANYTEIPSLPTDWDTSERELENDHFIEVQHVADYLFNAGHLTAHNLLSIRFGEIEHLSRYINMRDNIFTTPKDINRMKKQISIDCYGPGQKQNPLISN